MSNQERKVGMDECRGVLSPETWQTAQEVAVALGHKGSGCDSASVMARGCLHALTQCKMAESRPRKSDSPRSGKAPIEFRLTEHGADKSRVSPPAATRKAGSPSAAKKGKGGERPRSPEEKAAVRSLAKELTRPYGKRAATKAAPSSPKTGQEINATMCGSQVVLVRIPDRVSVDTLRGLTAAAETFARIGGHDEFSPFLPLALTAKK